MRRHLCSGHTPDVVVQDGLRVLLHDAVRRLAKVQVARFQIDALVQGRCDGERFQGLATRHQRTPRLPMATPLNQSTALHHLRCREARQQTMCQRECQFQLLAVIHAHRFDLRDRQRAAHLRHRVDHHKRRSREQTHADYSGWWSHAQAPQSFSKSFQPVQ